MGVPEQVRVHVDIRDGLKGPFDFSNLPPRCIPDCEPTDSVAGKAAQQRKKGVKTPFVFSEVAGEPWDCFPSPWVWAQPSSSAARFLAQLASGQV